MVSVANLVSVIVPCRNERCYIEAFWACVGRQQLPVGWSLELVVADGGSDDGTNEFLQGVAAAEPRLVLIANPGRIVSTGLNRALRHASGEIIVRMDVHTEYAPDYIAECIAALRETGADNAGGPWHAQAGENAGPLQRAVAAAFQSRWVAGGALSRRLDHSGWIDTVYLGSWPRAAFERFGDFDESLVRNQDDEHNLRIRMGGGRVWQSARIRSVYRPRAELSKVFRQYLQYGYWKPFVIRKHGRASSVRHVVPAAFVALLTLSSAAAALGASAWPVVSLVVAYALAVGAMTVAVATGQGLDAAACMRVPAVIAVYHVSYGIGSLFGWWDALRHGRGHERFASLTN